MIADYTLIRSKRKTLALYIRENGAEVRAPLKMPKSEIDRFVESKEKWIKKKTDELSARLERRKESSLLGIKYFIYRGENYPIVVKKVGRAEFDGERLCMPPSLTQDQVKEAYTYIYRSLANRDLTEKTLRFAQKMSVIPSAVKINSAKKRWGSCSAKKSINYSWRLIAAHDDVIDYVIVHELAHLKQMNHSARFWLIVEDIFPDYRSRRKKLNELQISID